MERAPNWTRLWRYRVAKWPASELICIDWPRQRAALVTNERFTLKHTHIYYGYATRRKWQLLRQLLWSRSHLFPRRFSMNFVRFSTEVPCAPDCCSSWLRHRHVGADLGTTSEQRAKEMKETLTWTTTPPTHTQNSQSGLARNRSVIGIAQVRAWCVYEFAGSEQ